MVVLDTDHTHLMQRHDSALRQKLLDRLADTGPDDLATTIVTYEEQTRGWLEYKARAKDISQEIEAYRRLKKHLDDYRTLNVLDFDERGCRGTAATPAHEDSHRDHGSQDRGHRARAGRNPASRGTSGISGRSRD